MADSRRAGWHYGLIFSAKSRAAQAFRSYNIPPLFSANSAMIAPAKAVVSGMIKLNVNPDRLTA